jgi:glycosyltransferase involved in cell wall biosynthesis
LVKIPIGEAALRVGIDCQLLHAQSGIGRYSRSLTRSLPAFIGGDDELFLLMYKKGKAEHYPSQVRALHVGVRQRFLWANLSLPLMLRRCRFDLYHALDNMSLPVLWPKGRVKYILTIHDLIPLLVSNSVRRAHRYYFRASIGRILQLADAIIVDSEWTKGLVVERYPAMNTRVHVIPLGVDLSLFRPISDQQALFGVRQKYGLGNRAYLLFTGVIEPKKNLSVLLRTYAQLTRTKRLGKEVMLVIAGPKGWRHREVFDLAETLGLGEDVVFPGPIDEVDLPALYSGAQLFVFPSLYEGFGLPPLEAMACGTPAIVSNRGALPEVIGEAGVMVDPGDMQGLAAHITILLEDEKRRAALREAGLAHARNFSWARCAHLTFDTYERTIARR